MVSLLLQICHDFYCVVAMAIHSIERSIEQLVKFNCLLDLTSTWTCIWNGSGCTPNPKYVNTIENDFFFFGLISSRNGSQSDYNERHAVNCTISRGKGNSFKVLQQI